ncbi:hypothetical protein FACS1894166_05240 [Bacilli bacterium]|nr:hypothetical protein FACS1894166_05240 [Bacilli bacterium]
MTNEPKVTTQALIPFRVVYNKVPKVWNEPLIKLVMMKSSQDMLKTMAKAAKMAGIK